MSDDTNTLRNRVSPRPAAPADELELQLLLLSNEAKQLARSSLEPCFEEMRQALDYAEEMAERYCAKLPKTICRAVPFIIREAKAKALKNVPEMSDGEKGSIPVHWCYFSILDDNYKNIVYDLHKLTPKNYVTERLWTKDSKYLHPLQVMRKKVQDKLFEITASVWKNVTFQLEDEMRPVSDSPDNHEYYLTVTVAIWHTVPSFLPREDEAAELQNMFQKLRLTLDPLPLPEDAVKALHSLEQLVKKG